MLSIRRADTGFTLTPWLLKAKAIVLLPRIFPVQVGRIIKAKIGQTLPCLNHSLVNRLGLYI